MTYTPRRLRRRPSPQYLLRVPEPLTKEMAERIKRDWRKASRGKVIVLNDDRVEVTRLR